MFGAGSNWPEVVLENAVLLGWKAVPTSPSRWGPVFQQCCIWAPEVSSHQQQQGGFRRLAGAPGSGSCLWLGVRAGWERLLQSPEKANLQRNREICLSCAGIAAVSPTEREGEQSLSSRLVNKPFTASWSTFPSCTRPGSSLVASTGFGSDAVWQAAPSTLYSLQINLNIAHQGWEMVAQSQVWPNISSQEKWGEISHAEIRH